MKAKYYVAIALTFVILLPNIALGAFKFDPGGSIASSLKLPTKDAESTVVSVVQYILTLLGLISVILILYGGFRYLTSGGNEEVIKQSKSILKSAVIGLVIILFAWAAVIFVISAYFTQ